VIAVFELENFILVYASNGSEDIFILLITEFREGMAHGLAIGYHSGNRRATSLGSSDKTVLSDKNFCYDS